MDPTQLGVGLSFIAPVPDLSMTFIKMLTKPLIYYEFRIPELPITFEFLCSVFWLASQFWMLNIHVHVVHIIYNDTFPGTEKWH